MGTIRFGLAMLVVYFHAHGREIFGIPMPDGRLAVQLFYVISGFYMALILNEKYKTAGANSLFYSNRFFRLWPPLMVVITLVVVQFVATGRVLLLGLETSLEAFRDLLVGLDLPTLAYLAFTNLFILGQDWIWYLRIDPATGVTWCPAFTCAAHNGSSFLLDHPTFTVAIEANYYLIAPFVLRRSLLAALGLCGLGAGWHLYVAAAGLDPLVWGYHFVPSAAFFFFLGACAYHGYAHFTRLPEDSGLRTLLQRLELPAYVASMLLAALIYKTAGEARHFVIAVLLALVIPLLFTRTRAHRLDRAVGELSYGIYLIHFPLYLLMQDLFGTLVGGIWTLGLVVPAAIVLYILVDWPVDRWRQRRARGALVDGAAQAASPRPGPTAPGVPRPSATGPRSV